MKQLDSLQWEALEDDDGNLYFEADSPYADDGVRFLWRLRPRMRRNKIVWVADHASELGGDCDGIEWDSLAEAQAAVLDAHNHIIKCEDC